LTVGAGGGRCSTAVRIPASEQTINPAAPASQRFRGRAHSASKRHAVNGKTNSRVSKSTLREMNMPLINASSGGTSGFLTRED